MENSKKTIDKSSKVHLFEMMEKINGIKVSETLLTEAKDEKWMQGAMGKDEKHPEGKHPGALHKDLGIPEDQKISMSLINSKIKELEKKGEGDKKLTKEELRLLHRLVAAKNMKKANEAFENSNLLDEINEISAIAKDIISEADEKLKHPFRKLVIDIDNDEGFLMTDENKYNDLRKYGKINKTGDEPFNVFGFLWYEWLEIPHNIAQTI
jgi:hypothetical protein